MSPQPHVWLLESEVLGPVNIGSGQAVSLRELAQTIGRFAGDVELIDWGARATPANEPDLLVADIARLSREVGFCPNYDSASGLADTVAWWQSNQPAAVS